LLARGEKGKEKRRMLEREAGISPEFCTKGKKKKKIEDNRPDPEMGTGPKTVEFTGFKSTKGKKFKGGNRGGREKDEERVSGGGWTVKRGGKNKIDRGSVATKKRKKVRVGNLQIGEKKVKRRFTGR